MDKDYRVACPPEQQASLKESAEFLNGRLNDIKDKGSIIGTERIATKREMPNDVLEDMRYFMHKDLLGSTDLVTELDGSIFQYLKFPFLTLINVLMYMSTLSRYCKLYILYSKKDVLIVSGYATTERFA